ncbi:MAG: hypothetical protein FJ104_11630, partial [Deltaproteobacteria bacterium]|nr:hypothetical protein [Deltaproteobacteria bacterium]
MKTRTRRTTALGGLVLALSACAPLDPPEGGAGSRVATLGLEDRLLLVNRGPDRAALLDTTGTRARARVDFVDLPTHVIAVEARAGAAPAREALLLSQGTPDARDQVAEAPSLFVIGADGATRSYPLPAPYDTLTQAEDGRYALLHHSRNAGGDGLFNANEIALIDLDDEGESAVQVKTLRSLDGSRPTTAVISPPVPIGGVDRRLVAVLFDRAVALFDAARAGDLPEYTVELSTDPTRTFSIGQALFSRREARLYLRAQGVDDVFVLSALPSPGGSQNDFVPNLNVLGVGGAPADLALFEDEGAERVLVAAPGLSSLVVVDPDTNRSTRVPLPYSATQVHPFVGPSPRDATEAPRAWLEAPGARQIVFVDLPRIDAEGARNVEPLLLAQSPGSLLPLDDRLVLLPHAQTGFSLLDLHDRTVAAFQGPSLGDALADLPAGRLWVPAGGEVVGHLALDGLRVGTLRLDRPVGDLVRVPSATSPRLVVDHRGAAGEVTVIDAKDPRL